MWLVRCQQAGDGHLFGDLARKGCFRSCARTRGRDIGVDDEWRSDHPQWAAPIEVVDAGGVERLPTSLGDPIGDKDDGCRPATPPLRQLSRLCGGHHRPSLDGQSATGDLDDWGVGLFVGLGNEAVAAKRFEERRHGQVLERVDAYLDHVPKATRRSVFLCTRTQKRGLEWARGT